MVSRALPLLGPRALWKPPARFGSNAREGGGLHVDFSLSEHQYPGLCFFSSVVGTLSCSFDLISDEGLIILI